MPTPLPPSDCIPRNTDIQLGTVTQAVGGDALEVEVNGQLVTVVYAGVEAPAAAQTFNASMVEGQTAVLVRDTLDADDQGRLLRYVMIGDHFINVELIQQGYAQTATTTAPACAAVFEQAEAQARNQRLGLWAPTVVPTLTFFPTVGLSAPAQSACDCSIRWTCSNFNTQAQAQACFNACNDYNSRLDQDHNGTACDALP